MSAFLILLAVAAQAGALAKGHSVTITLDAPVGGKAYVTGHLLNCRTAPAPDAQILTTIPQSVEVVVRRQQGDWQLLQLKTKSCWVSTRYLATGRASAASKRY